MMLIRMTITILLIATFKATVEGYGLPIFYSLDNEWKSSADDTLGYNNAPQSQALSTWGNFRKKSHKLFPSVVSNSSSSLNSVLENSEIICIACINLVLNYVKFSFSHLLIQSNGDYLLYNEETGAEQRYEG